MGPFELVSRLQRPLALGWPWPGLGIGRRCGTIKCSFLSQGLLIRRENLCLAVGFLCPQLFPQEVRSWGLRQRGAEARFWVVFRLTCVCLFGLYLTFIHVGLIFKRAHACVYVGE